MTRNIAPTGNKQLQIMNIRLFSILTLLTICLCGCTSTALRRNAFNQSKTVGDFLADQALYNLALYKDYYEASNFNGLPSFVKLATGQAQVQQSISGQVGVKIPIAGGDEVDPQIMGNHQTQDNWSFIPVVDPGEISRLYYLYRAEFKPISEADLMKVFPSPPSLDQQGRPFLDYTPRTNKESGNVEMISNQPVFDAKPKIPNRPKLSDIPGAIIDDQKHVTNGWFSFTQPSNTVSCHRVGPYLNKYIWITNGENFFKFTLLTLGETNASVTKSSSPVLLFNNGVIRWPQ